MGLGTFLKESRRVLKVTKKPTTDEYKQVGKIVLLGMIIIGVIGFIITIIHQFIILKGG